MIHRRIVLGVIVALLVSVPSFAGAVPQSKIERAKAVKSQVDALNHKVEVAAERYNVARINYNAATNKRRAADSKLRKTVKRINTIQGHLNNRANNMYRQGQGGFLEVLLGAQSFDDFAATWDILNDLNEQDASNVEELKELRAETRKLRKTLVQQEQRAQQNAQAMRESKESIESQLSERQGMLRGLEAEIDRLEAAEEAARRAQSSSSFSSSGGSFPPPTRAPRSEVVSIAKRYLGAPYVWAASGPNSFDCSGLTMFVYRQVGVSLPHSSRAQIGYGQRVSRSDLAPGDLVFFGSPIHHVGMYVGGGMYIHAPQTGDVVKISSLNRGDYAGACRP